MPLLRARRPVARVAVVGAGADLPAWRAVADLVALGRLDPAKLELAFAAADVFAMPTHEEALGQMGLEALAQGTPVVCYANSGPCSYVVPGVTGLQVATRSPQSLAAGLLEVLEAPSDYSQAAVRQGYEKLLEEKFSLDGQAARYLDFYREVSGWPRPLARSRISPSRRANSRS